MGSSCSLIRKRKCCTLGQKDLREKICFDDSFILSSSADFICLIIKSEKLFIGFPTP